MDREKPKPAVNEIPIDKATGADLLYDANVHAQNAETRIHSLRERLQEKHRRDKHNHLLHDKMNKVVDTSQEEEFLMGHIRKLEEMLRRRDEVNNRYAIQLNDMVRKDGEVESLKVENIALQKKLELIANSLAWHSETQSGYEREKGESTYRKDELERLRDEKRRLFRELGDKDGQLKSINDAYDARSHEISAKKAELENLRVSTKDLSEKLIVVGRKKDEALVRLTSEKEALEGELTRKKDEKIKVTKENESLQSDVKEKEQTEEEITDLLRARDSELVGLREDQNGLAAQVAELEALRRKLTKVDSKIKEANEELTRRTRKYWSLASEEVDLEKEVAAQKLITANGNAAYNELEKKIAEFQDAITGSHDKEVALLGKIDHAQHQIDELKPKNSAEMLRHTELERQNAILKQKLSELAESSLVEQRKLREHLEELTAKEVEMGKQKNKIKQMLTTAIAENGGYIDKIESYKAMQTKDDQELETMTLEEKEAEEKLQQRIRHLLRQGDEKDRALAEASEMEAEMANRMALLEKQKELVQMEIAKREQAIIELQNMILKMQRQKAKQKQDNNYDHKARIKALEAEVEGLQAKARSVQQTLTSAPYQIEAQNKRLKSLEEQIHVRDQQINTLSQAIHNTKLASAKKPVVALQDMRYGYVTAIVDHRQKTDEVVYYKHRNPIEDYQHHLHVVNKMPEVSIETVIERRRRREAKMRNRNERRPSLS